MQRRSPLELTRQQNNKRRKRLEPMRNWRIASTKLYQTSRVPECDSSARGFSFSRLLGKRVFHDHQYPLPQSCFENTRGLEPSRDHMFKAKRESDEIFKPWSHTGEENQHGKIAPRMSTILDLSNPISLKHDTTERRIRTTSAHH